MANLADGDICFMLAMLIVVPLAWMALLWGLDKLEDLAVMPDERATKISRYLEEAEPDEIEIKVAHLLAGAVLR